jgi:hypothetical protein
MFVIDLQDASKKLILYYNFFCLLFFKVHLHHFLKIKSQQESLNSRNQGFSYYFCMIIEGSGSGAGSIPMTSGSGSRSWRPKNMWIRWIRIRNTGCMEFADSAGKLVCDAKFCTRKELQSFMIHI